MFNTYNIPQAKAPWSWGRTYDLFVTFFRKGARSNPPVNWNCHWNSPSHSNQNAKWNLKRKQTKRTPVNDHIDARAGARSKRTRSEALKATKKKRLDSKDVNWERERKKRGEKGVEGGRKNNMKHSKELSVKHETSPVGAYLLH